MMRSVGNQEETFSQLEGLTEVYNFYSIMEDNSL